jgi:hypothetical protein
MKTLFRKSLARSSVLAALAAAGFLSVGAVHAAGTLSGTAISNLATLSYSVGAAVQPTIGSSATGNTSGAGTATSFVVDNKVNLTVTESGNIVASVAPGSTNQVTTFTVTNLGNTAQGYTFVAVNQLAGSAVIAGTADTIDVSNFRVFVDSNGNGVYDPLVDTAIAISTLAPDATRTVFVVADIPAGATNGQQANITLTATTTTTGTTTPVVATVGADTAGVDIVFADAATTELAFVGTSAARDAQATARDAYRIASAVISVAKTSTLMCDPFNGSGPDRKNIPGSIVRWTITISNALTATTSATLAQVSDTLNANTTFDANLVTGAGAPATATSCTSAGGVPESAAGSGFKIDVTGDTRAAGSGGAFPAFLTTGANADGATHAGGVVTIDYSQALPAGGAYGAGELKPGESVVVYFNVSIN